MAKTRMLKHDLRTSEKVASWPIPLRYFWVLLWGYVDDHGKGKDNPQLIKADCFPLDDDVTADQIDVWLDRFLIDGVVARYTVDGTRYIKVINWSEHQKPPHPSPEKFPGPDAPGAVARNLHASLMSDAEQAQETFTPGLGLGWVESGLGGGAADAAKEPPLFCSQHPQGTDEKCRLCGDARRAHDKWIRDLAKPADTPAAPPRVKHIPGLCDAHRQREGECDMCAREAKERAEEEHAAEVIQGRFGAA